MCGVSVPLVGEKSGHEVTWGNRGLEAEHADRSAGTRAGVWETSWTTQPVSLEPRTCRSFCIGQIFSAHPSAVSALESSGGSWCYIAFEKITVQVG